MIHAFEPLRELVDGEYPGADTYWNPLAARNHWLYGQAHGLNFPFAQRWGSGIVAPIWEGETTQRPEHTTLYFCARISLSAGGVARLQYYADPGGWTDVATDTDTTHLRFLGGSSAFSVSLAGLTPADGVWTFRLQLTGAGGWGHVYYAYLSGSTGFAAWPASLPTFTNGLPTNAVAVNKLREMQQHLLDCARQPRVPALMGTVTHRQTGSDETVYRWTFRYGCTQRLYYYLDVSGLSGGGHVRLYLEPATYDQGAGDSRIATLVDAVTDGVYAGNDDLSLRGLSVGQRYGLELVAYEGAVVTVGNLVLGDLGAVTRTYLPKDDWVHGDTPTAALLGTIRDDLDQMYPAANRQSPLWPEHDLATWHRPEGEYGMFTCSSNRFRGVRRWRYLRYRGAGRLVSADGTVTVSLSDTDPPGGAQVLDLESVAVPYGMEYYVESYGSGVITVAYEDYA